KAPVYLRITKGRRISYIASDIKLEPKYWDVKNNKVKSSYTNSARANNYLNNFILQYENEILKENMANAKVSVRSLKEKITGSNALSFFEVADQLLENYRLQNSIGTFDKSRSIIKKLEEYIGSS